LRIDLRRRGCWERLLGLLRSLCFCVVESIESIRLSVVESLGRSAYVKKRGCVHASYLDPFSLKGYTDLIYDLGARRRALRRLLETLFRDFSQMRRNHAARSLFSITLITSLNK